jgi:hypothetical protein
MDSYNRDYGAGLGSEEDGLGSTPETKIGNASILSDSDILRDENGARLDQGAGFYAIAYTIGSGVDGLASGTKVISYRGTSGDSFWKVLTDAWNGYGTALGSPNNPQAYLAAEFYQAVTGTTNGDPRDGDVTLTGHSLGGGLAGLIAAAA